MILASIEPTQAYGMYAPDEIGESSADLFMSFESRADDTLTGWDITPSQPGDGDEGDGPVIPAGEEKEEASNLWDKAFQPIVLVAVIVVFISIFVMVKRRKEKDRKSQKSSKAESKPELKSKENK